MHFQRLRDLREDKDMNQSQIAKLLHTSQTVYSRYERGFQTIPVEHLLILADFYGVSVDFILGRTNVKELNKPKRQLSESASQNGTISRWSFRHNKGDINMNGKNPHSGHRERLRQRFLNSECDQLYEHELLELLLFYARPVVNTNNIAHALTEEFGTVGKVLSAERDELQKVKGVGSSGALFIKLMNDLGLDYLRRVNSFDTLSTRSKLFDLFTEQFSNSDANICTVLCLGPRSELVDTLTLPISDICSGTLPQKELASMMLRSSTVKVCVSINHGSRLSLPNDLDYLAASTFARLLSAIGIGFEDCIIFGSGICFSMREKGAFTF